MKQAQQVQQVLLGVAVLVVFPMAVLASGGAPSGGGRQPSPEASAPRLTPEEQAAAAYNDGLKHTEKANSLRKSSVAEADDAKKHDKLVAQAGKEYEKALRDFEDATQKNPKLFQAFAGIGYAQRKLGNYDAALAAYNHALELEPAYAPAIEYRAEAYLGLNRLDDAKAAYTALFTGDRKRADELHAAMKNWLEMRRKDPGGVAPEAIEEFGKWVEQRQQIAATTSQLLPQKANRW